MYYLNFLSTGEKQARFPFQWWNTSQHPHPPPKPRFPFQWLNTSPHPHPQDLDFLFSGRIPLPIPTPKTHPQPLKPRLQDLLPASTIRTRPQHLDSKKVTVQYLMKESNTCWVTHVNTSINSQQSGLFQQTHPLQSNIVFRNKYRL